MPARPAPLLALLLALASAAPLAAQRRDTAAVPPCAGAPEGGVAGVTPAGLRAVEPEMTYDAVAAVLGGPGARVDSAATPGAAVWFRWTEGPLTFIQVAFRDGRAVASTQAGLYPRAQSGAPVTRAGYDRLRQGMAFEEATAAMGSPGLYAGFGEAGETWSVSYLWHGGAPGSMATASFIDGRLWEHAQTGLD